MRALLVLICCLAAFAHADDKREAILVAAVDIPTGTKVTLEMLSQRPAPARLATEAIVKPDAVTYVVGQPTRRPMLKGDLVLWSAFNPIDRRILEGCEQKFTPAPVAVEQVRRARAAVVK